MRTTLQLCGIVRCDPNKPSSSPARPLREATGPEDPSLETMTQKEQKQVISTPSFQRHDAALCTVSGGESPQTPVRTSLQPSGLPEEEKRLKSFFSRCHAPLGTVRLLEASQSPQSGPTNFRTGDRAVQAAGASSPPRFSPLQMRHPGAPRSVGLFSPSQSACLCLPKIHQPPLPRVMVLGGEVFGR